MAIETSSAETSVRKKAYVPDYEKDYDLCRIGIEEAENGVVISCGYKLKDSVREKMNKQEKQGMYCGSTYRDDSKHVFDDKAKAKQFIMDELNKMWSE